MNVAIAIGAVFAVVAFTIGALTFAVPVLLMILAFTITVLVWAAQGIFYLISGLFWCGWFLVDPKGAMAGKPSAKTYRQDASPWGDKPFRRNRS